VTGYRLDNRDRDLFFNTTSRLALEYIRVFYLFPENKAARA
jgi:hypothetical protein